MATPEQPATPLGSGSPETNGSGSTFLDLPKGKPLGGNMASSILRARSTPIVLLAGAAKSGKTTLLASLHDSFQRQPFAGYLAGGSQTLIGFEERCFDSRKASRRGAPTTGRTTLKEGLLFYHLRLRDQDLKGPMRDLLLADMSGEFYDRAVDSAAEMRELTIIARADHFVYLVDGASLESKELRNHTHSNAIMFMRRCFEEQMLERDARVDVLLTKWDIVRLRCKEAQANAFIEEQRGVFIGKFGNRVARLRVLPVAARPHYKSALPLAYGLEDLLRCWAEEAPRKLAQETKRFPVPRLNRAFDGFALREAPELFEGGHDA